MLDASYRSNRGEELEHVNSAKSTARTIPERKLQEVTNLREQLQQMEIELAREIARSEMLELQNSFEDKLKEHTDRNNNLKEQLHEREQHILNLERKVEQKDREP